MSQLMNNVEYLAKSIGPRPAGTEEEQRAALYITEQFQKEAGFSSTIEDFSSTSSMEAGLAALAAVEVAATILAMIFPILCIPAFILAAAAAVIYALEAFDQPILSRILSRGASQNVVAKYQPAADAPARSGRGHTRKIILVAHYDTGRVTPSIVSRVESSGIPAAFSCVIGMIAAAFFLLLRIFVVSGGGMALLALNVLSIIAVAVCLLPIVKALLIRSSPYNEGACNNATGTAALLEVARRISRGSVSEARLADEFGEGVVIHGEAAAREAGLIPEGVQLEYEADLPEPPAEIGSYSDEERLLSAKAAIAALTGKPVESRVYGSVADNLVNSHAESGMEADGWQAEGAPGFSEGQVAGAAGVSVTGAPAHDFSSVPGVTATPFEPATGVAAEGFENAPSWFVAAQQNARKTERYNADEAPQVKRSRYTEAIENAERGFIDREEEARAADLARREEEARAALAGAGSAEPAAESVEPVVELTEPAAQSDSAEPAAVAAAANAAESAHEPSPTFRSAVPVNPGGTVAMPAPISAAEIRAEALAAESEAAALASLEAEPEPLDGAQDRMAKLPSIDPSDPYSPAPTTNPSRSGILRKLRTNIPSLSGLIAPVGVDDRERPSVSGATSATSSADGGASPAVALGHDSVEVPRSRSGNLLNRLRKNDEDDLVGTPQEWLNVDDDFEARSVGRARGGWESFRDEQYDDWSSESDQGGSGRSWEGGAFSRVELGHVSTLSGEETDIVEEPVVEELDPALSGEIEQIYHFRNPQFNTEIWFVAMGADGISHDGTRAFLEEHRDELRGATIVEIESLGVGNLAVASEEGRVRKVTASSRVKRFTRGATAATGIPVDSVSLVGSDSVSSTLQKAGFQAVHLFGAENGRPALKGSADDVLENVNEQALEEHVSFIFELLKD